MAYSMLHCFIIKCTVESKDAYWHKFCVLIRNKENYVNEYRCKFPDKCLTKIIFFISG